MKNMAVSAVSGTEIYLKSETSAENKYNSTYVIYGIILFLGLFGMLEAFTAAFKLQCSWAAALICSVLYAIGAVTLFILTKNKRRIIAVIVLLWAAAGIVLNKELYCGLQCVFNQCLAAINESKGLEISLLPVKMPKDPQLLTSAVLAYVMLPVALLLSYAVLYRFNLFMLLLLAAPTLEIGTYYGLTPGLLPYLLIISFVGSAAVIHYSGNKPLKYRSIEFHDERSSAAVNANAGIMGLAAAVVLGMLLIAAGIFMPSQKYNEFIMKSQVVAKIDQVFHRDFWNRILSRPVMKVHGGITGGRPGITEKYNFSGETDLVITADSLRNSIYLRGFAGDYYSEGRWVGLPDKYKSQYKNVVSRMGLEPWRLSCEALDINKALLSPVFQSELRKISVRNLNAPEQYAYVPYNAVYENGLKAPMDGNAKVKGKNYTLKYYDINNYENSLFLFSRKNIRNGLLGSIGNGGGKITEARIKDYFNAESRYSSYVHKAYTRLPRNLPNKLAEDFGKLQYTSIEALIKTVTGKLSSMAAYTLSPGSVPKGKDPVEHFLYESRKGFCTDFATAAALIFRMHGIPARYVEGYVLTVEDYTSAENRGRQYVIKVKDSNSHAWVELYLDGFGWVPVEVTPGFTQLTAKDDAVSGETSEYETEAGRMTNKLKIMNPVISAKEKGLKPSNTFRSKGGSPVNQSRNKISTGLKCVCLIAVLLIAGILAVIFNRKRLIKKRGRLIENEGLNTAALTSYEILVNALNIKSHRRCEYISDVEFSIAAELLLSVKGLALAAEIVLKAAFSGKNITREEYDSAAGTIGEAVKIIYQGSPIRDKLKLRYIYAYI